MRPPVLALLVVGGLLGSAHRAAAECKRQVWLGTPSGTPLPATGSLYLEDESGHFGDVPLAVTFTGHPGTYSRTRLTPQLERLDYVTLPGATIDIMTDSWIAPAVYPVAWAPPAAAPRALQYWHEQYRWTCSGSDLLAIQLDEPVAAVIARWTAGGATSEWTVAPFTRGDYPTLSLVELGTIDCGSSATLPPAQLVAGGELALTAILLDGTRVPVRGLPRHIAAAEMPRSTEPHGLVLELGLGSLAAAAPPARPAPAVPAGWNPFRDLDTALALALGGGIALAVGLVLALRHRPTLREL